MKIELRDGFHLATCNTTKEMTDIYKDGVLAIYTIIGSKNYRKGTTVLSFDNSYNVLNLDGMNVIVLNDEDIIGIIRHK